MKTVASDLFVKSYRAAPPQIQRAIDKQIRFLLHDLKHPSLHAKKYNESRNLWQARVNQNWRFYFKIEKDTYCLIDVMSHPK